MEREKPKSPVDLLRQDRTFDYIDPTSVFEEVYEHEPNIQQGAEEFRNQILAEREARRLSEEKHTEIQKTVSA